MPEHILDPANDGDYVNILAHGSTVSVKKESSKTPDTNIRVGEERSGIMKSPLRIGTPLMLEGQQGSTQTTPLENIHVTDALGQIRVTTKNAVYKVDVVDPGKKYRRMSLLYLRRGYLDFQDHMPDGFYDGGRRTKFKVEGDTMTPQSDRELLVLNEEQDPGLRKILEKARGLVAGVQDLSAKIKMLSLYVSNVMGGSQLVKVPQSHGLIDGRGLNDIEALTDNEIRQIQNQPSNVQKIVPLGYLTHGVCRHRALLFKYLADRLDIPSRLVRGDYGGPRGGHAWNVVKLENKILGGDDYFVVDVMHDQTQLYQENSPMAKNYKRKDAKGMRAGFGGRSVGRVG